jgi:hypothetical protein
MDKLLALKTSRRKKLQSTSDFGEKYNTRRAEPISDVLMRPFPATLFCLKSEIDEKSISDHIVQCTYSGRIIPACGEWKLILLTT